MYGPIGVNGKITGNNAAYIYPRSNLGLIGKFEESQMKSAQKAVIKKISCKHNVLSVEFGEKSGPYFSRSISTNHSLGDKPFVQDPYEAITVTIENSKISNFGMFHISCLTLSVWVREFLGAPANSAGAPLIL